MGDPRWLTESEQQAWQAFINTSHLLERRLDQQLERDAGLSHLQYAILVRLDTAPQRELRMSELAAMLLDSKSKLTYQIERLVQAGLVRRRSCADDLRAVYAVLTEDGRRKLEAAAPGHVATVRELFIDPLTPQQLAIVAEGLGKLARRLSDAITEGA